ncbi:MAG: elongation factor Ts [Coxiellaceae bacterium]|nr:elongation factor Ts [Coxiellaceae bacterium]
MVTITAQMVKELREMTGAGMMECKKALTEAEGSLENAIDIMRTRGQAKAAKRASKIAAEGIVVTELSDDGLSAMMIEVNCETDFVARDSNFLQFSHQLARKGLEAGVTSVEALMALPASSDSTETFEQQREGLINKIGENVKVRRCQLMTSTGIVGSYNHGTRIGVLVDLTQANAELAKDVAMHIAASNPQAIDESGVDAALIEKEKTIFVEQAKESGKPDNIIEKMVQGRVSKFLKEICLVSQPFVKDPDQTIAQLLKSADASIAQYVRFEVGEGIEKETVDFAEEVKAQVAGS